MTTTKNSQKIRRHSLATLLALIGTSPCVSWSQIAPPVGDPHNPVRKDEVLGVELSQSLKYDSNVFRLPAGGNTTATSESGQRHDFVSTTGVRAAIDKDFGRHRLFLLAAPSLVRYAKFDQFNYVGQDFLADWSGRLGTNNRYGLNYQHVKYATNPADQVVPTGNTATKDLVGADLSLPVAPRFQAVTAWRADRTRNSAETEKGGDNDGWAADAGVRYAPSSGNNADLRYRHSRYTYPNIVPSELSDNSYSQNEVELSGNWQLNEPSRIEGRTSYVRRRHDNFEQRDFSGWVGSAKYIWRPTIATSTSLRVYRELGAVTDASASYAKTYGLSVQPGWDATSKLSFGALFDWQRRSYNGFAVSSRPAERISKVGVNADFAATRNWKFGLGVSDEQRHSSDPAHSYSDLIASMTAEWKM